LPTRQRSGPSSALQALCGTGARNMSGSQTVDLSTPERGVGW
jgi:hypothetical protein